MGRADGALDFFTGLGYPCPCPPPYFCREGASAYVGRADGALDFFTGLGYPCPPYENPAEHIMAVITPTLADSAADLM